MYCVILLIFATATIFNTKSFLIFSHNTYEGFMSLDPGFSSARNLVDQGVLLHEFVEVRQHALDVREAVHLDLKAH